MAKRKLNYRFHNPNPVEVTADYILKVMIEANTEKVEKILRENMVQMEQMNMNWNKADRRGMDRKSLTGSIKVYNFVENCRNVNYEIKYEILSRKTVAKIKKWNIIKI